MSQHSSRPFLTILAAAAVTGALGFGGLQAIAQTSGTGSGTADAETADQQIFIMPRSGPFAPETVAVPNARVIAGWARSGHSHYTSESFSHWNAEGEIPPVCSVCHSGIGFRSFHGLDGTPKGLPEAPVQTGGVVDCDTCHNPGLPGVTEVTLPSGVVHPVTSTDAACVTCHQGRESGLSIETATADKPDDTIAGDLRFINPHYNIAAVTNLGAYGKGGYHYPGKEYSGRFLHAKPVATCVSCHDPHSLEIAESTCLTCHTTGTPEDIRISRVSFDGSGDTGKGIHADITANADTLMKMMTEYAATVAGTPMIYDNTRYPYFFADANGDGVIDQEGSNPVAYNAWTPRLLKATFNWKFVTADPGIFAHNPPYALELLYDSIADLAEPLNVDMATLGLLR